MPLSVTRARHLCGRLLKLAAVWPSRSYAKDIRCWPWRMAFLKAPTRRSVENKSSANSFFVATAVRPLKEEGVFPNCAQLWQCKYLSNLIEQDHQFIKRRVNPGLGYFRFKYFLFLRGLTAGTPC